MLIRTQGLIARINGLRGAVVKRVECGEGGAPISDHSKREYVAVRNEVFEALPPEYRKHLPLMGTGKDTVESMSEAIYGDLLECYNTISKLINADDEAGCLS